VLEQIEVAGQSTLVLGDGRLGLLVAQVLKGAGARVTLAGKHPDKLHLARTLDLEARTRPEVTGRYDIVVDATGRREGLTDALAFVRPRGTVVLKSTFHGTMALEPWPIVVDEITIVGSRCGPFSRALDVLSRGDVQVEPLIAAVFPLSNGAAALDAAARQVKVLIEMPFKVSAAPPSA
jgi:alcohol dehydrogenase